MNDKLYQRIMAEAKTFTDELKEMPDTEEVFMALFGLRLQQLYTQPVVLEEALTPREVELVRHLSKGLTNIEIGREMTISKNTVKEMISRIAGKLDVHTRTEIANRAIKLGLV